MKLATRSQESARITSGVVLLCLSLCLTESVENVFQPDMLFPEGDGDARLRGDELHTGSHGRASSDFRAFLVERLPNNRLRLLRRQATVLDLLVHDFLLLRGQLHKRQQV